MELNHFVRFYARFTAVAEQQWKGNIKETKWNSILYIHRISLAKTFILRYASWFLISPIFSLLTFRIVNIVGFFSLCHSHRCYWYASHNHDTKTLLVLSIWYTNIEYIYMKYGIFGLKETSIRNIRGIEIAIMICLFGIRFCVNSVNTNYDIVRKRMKC